MNFEFSDDVTTMRAEVNRFLTEQLPVGVVRQRIETGARLDQELWSKIAEMGWLGVAIPEEFGGVELGYEALCMIAEEIGGVLPSVPFSSSIYLASQAILVFGSQAQKEKYLPRLAEGSMIGTFALAEGAGDPAPSAVRAQVSAGRVSGGGGFCNCRGAGRRADGERRTGALSGRSDGAWGGAAADRIA
jgi:alkylation response protein AidB-like acyl-CoA dehydrogenase